MLRNLLFVLIYFLLSSTLKASEIVCHFDLETDEIGIPLCDQSECIFEVDFPNYEGSRIIRATIEHQQGEEFFKANLALEKNEEGAHTTMYFSKTHAPMTLEVLYQLKSCVGRIKYEISRGNLKKIR